MNVNLTAIVILLLGGSVILMPLMIVALRFAVIPLIEVFLTPRDAAGRTSDRERIARLEQRLALLLNERVSSGNAGQST